MDVSITAALALVAAALAALSGWLGARPFDPRKGPRLLPYRFLMLVCAAVVLFMIVHLVNLAGFTTGR
jgi:hypothetical protein